MRDVPQVTVVIGTYNRLRHLKVGLESVRNELAEVPYELIVVDGGSTDGTTRWLVRQKDVIAIVQHNRGSWRGQPLPRRSWGYFMNLGFRAGSGELICMLSDDTLVLPGAVREGIEVYRRRTAAGEQIGGVAFWWRNWPHDRDYRVGLTWGGRMFVNHGLYSRPALEAVHYIDADSYSFYHADGDLGLRMWEAGFTCVDSPRSYVEHYADAAPLVRRGNLARQQEDWQTYERRWSHLGAPDADWLWRAHADAQDTVRRYWGPLLTTAVYRRGLQASATARILAERVRARGS
jgi:GT2 family glycosyltransferase